MQIVVGFYLEQSVHEDVTNEHKGANNTMNQIDIILLIIAQKHLNIETLETRRSDKQDFYDLAVWNIKDALQAAFMAGCEVGATVSIATEAEAATKTKQA